ncbi:hypothetical protein N7494_003331 [Penicillium frequentans]|uniref:Cryptic loci regulator 2 C-terminal domain-containing protein n=1 Tax=Penicillium frequentans TaxID=3151616 RepID=A0AAD6GH84_9EURO|nr:hypothetical protein N7494_003331 [Penicillium glabrum]
MSNDDLDDQNLVVIPVDPILSDGDSGTVPVTGAPGNRFVYRPIDDSGWRARLAEMWVEETGAREGGVKYILDQLPEGYAVYDRARLKNPSGPAKGDQPTKGDQLAKGGQRRRRRTKAEMEAARALEEASRAAGTTNGSARSSVKRTLVKVDSQVDSLADMPQDNEGPDYWKIHVAKLKKSGTVDEEINHPLNMDWALTHEWLADYFVRLQLQPAFIPRRGEAVLWTRELEGPLVWNGQAKRYMIHKDSTWIAPEWRAGIITQTPEEPTSFLDIVQSTDKTNPSISYSGFRVETVPDPLNDDDKAYSSQYSYVPLKCIKPFSAYEKFLHGTPRENLHPSIEYAMTTMASWSLLSHTRFKGAWPNAKVYSQGIFIGPELLAVKDTVRLKPFGLKQEQMEDKGSVLHSEHDPVDVMVIEKVWLELEECHEDPKDPLLATRCVPYISGKVYTRDANRLTHDISFDKDPLQKLTIDETTNAFCQVGMSTYGDWYRVAGGRTCVVSPPMIIGRCHEPEATILHFGSKRLDYDLHGTLNGRRYSGEVDTRMPEGYEWFWGDNRVETLGLATVNGVEVGIGAEQRERPDRWQTILRMLHLPYSDADIRKAELPRKVGRPPKNRFGEVGKTSKLVSTGLGVRSGSSSSDAVGVDMMDEDEDPSEKDLSEGELTAPVLYRGGTEETEGGDYNPGNA